MLKSTALAGRGGHMSPQELALLRSWVQGVGWDVIGEMYLDDADRSEVIRVIQRLRARLARKAQQGLAEAFEQKLTVSLSVSNS